MLPTREPFATLRRLKGDANLLPLYAGVLSGARRSMDDWIPLPALEGFRAFLGAMDLAVVEDCLFEPIAAGENLDALHRSPTTHCRGLPLRDLDRASSGAQVHVFVARKKQHAEEALKSFSYPVAVPKDRLLIRPRVDAYRLGNAFGYPRCCVESFLRWNNWTVLSHFSHAYGPAPFLDWRSNCLPRNTPFMANFHTPCGTDCAETISMAQRTVETILELDPDYGRAIIENLRGVFFVLNEALAYKLHDAEFLSEGAVRFTRAEPMVPLRSIAPPQVTRAAHVLEGATWIEITDGIVLTRGEEERFYEVEPTTEWVDDPLILRFTDGQPSSGF
jgi:hypothetical protein